MSRISSHTSQLGRRINVVDKLLTLQQQRTGVCVALELACPVKLLRVIYFTGACNVALLGTMNRAGIPVTHTLFTRFIDLLQLEMRYVSLDFWFPNLA
jgi:hypothetical protein